MADWKNLFHLRRFWPEQEFRHPLSEEHLQQYLAVIRDMGFAFDAVADHVVITDAEANIIYANKAAEKNTGFSRDEMIGRNPGDLWGGQMPKELYEKMWHTIKIDKQPFVGEVKNKRKDGTEYWQEIHISPILWENGDVKFFIGIEPNITDKKEKEKFREEFMSILAHQLKTPLVAIRWMLDWLLEKGELTREQKANIETIYEENKGVIDLVGDLLIISRMKDIQAANENINVESELSAIIKTTEKRFPRVSFSFGKEGGAFPLSCNRTLALQVFTNIIVNAAEYSEKNSGRVDIMLAVQDGSYIFSCQDNGIGIPANEQPKIFSRLYRASNAKQMKENGTGLGLFIVKMITDSLGWKITFESAVGKGTTFRVEIPRGK